MGHQSILWQYHVKSNYNVTCISWIAVHLPNILIFCWQELVTEYQYQAKFWSDTICVVTCNQICPVYCFFADKNLWPNMNIRQSSGQILSVLWLATWFIHVFLCYSSSKWNHLIQHTSFMIWWSNLLRLKVFNLTFASLSYSILTFNTVVIVSVGKILWRNFLACPACSWKPAGMGCQQPQVVMNPCCLQLWRKNAGAGLCYISAFSACICALTVVSTSSSNRLLLTLCRLCVYVCVWIMSTLSPWYFILCKPMHFSLSQVKVHDSVLQMLPMNSSNVQIPTNKMIQNLK